LHVGPPYRRGLDAEVAEVGVVVYQNRPDGFAPALSGSSTGAQCLT
jgi:hypothetical protein